MTAWDSRLWSVLLVVGSAPISLIHTYNSLMTQLLRCSPASSNSTVGNGGPGGSSDGRCVRDLQGHEGIVRCVDIDASGASVVSHTPNVNPPALIMVTIMNVILHAWG